MELLVLDGNSILNRAFYGIKLLTTKDGVFTNAIFGFLSIYQRLCDEVHPDAVAAAFDLKAPTFRHRMYNGYKAGRKPMPPELAAQMPLLKDLLDAMGVRTVTCEGYEADDILGTLSAAAAARGDHCTLATGDRDSLQLVGPRVTVLLTATRGGQSELRRYDEQQIAADYGGLTPRQLIDVKALQGDAADKIPGVAKVGEKTALDLIQRFHSVEELYAGLDTADIRDNLRQNLRAGEADARLSYTLGRIVTDAPIDTDPAAYRLTGPDKPRLAGLLSRLELFKWIDRWGLRDVEPVAPAAVGGSAAPAVVCRTVTCRELTAALPPDGRLWWLAEEGKALAVTDGQTLWLAEHDDNADADALTVALCRRADAVTHDTKRAYHLAAAAGADLRQIPVAAFDTLLAGYLLNPLAAGYGLDRLFAEYGLTLPEVSGAPENRLTLCRQTAALPALQAALSARLDEEGQAALLRDIELPLARVLAAMERDGFPVDAAGIAAFGRTLEGRIREIEQSILAQVGEPVNLNSPKQLGHALFEVLGLPAKKKTKSGYSTNAEVLEELRHDHPVVEELLEYRQLTKLKSTYCDGLTAAIAPDGRIRSTLNQTETRTGRISSAEPNLQNIPVRRQLGREMRRFFTARPGWVLCDADYSQIELRLLAAMADDRAMIDAFRRGDDIHAITASQVFGMPLEMVTPLMRSRAKAVNFGIVYGISAHSLAEDLGIGYGEAKRYIDGYYATYPGVATYMEQAVQTARERGWAETLFGRRRPLPELTASNGQLRKFGERVARNMPIQGTAADVIKIAMIRVWQRLAADGLRARLILQVHDELIVEAPPEEADAVCALLRQEMEGAVELAVPLTVDVHAGATWYDAKQ